MPPTPHLLAPVDLIHNILANANNAYWAEKKAEAGGKGLPKKGDLVQVAPGGVLQQLNLEELKRVGGKP